MVYCGDSCGLSILGFFQLLLPEISLLPNLQCFQTFEHSFSPALFSSPSGTLIISYYITVVTVLQVPEALFFFIFTSKAVLFLIFRLDSFSFPLPWSCPLSFPFCSWSHPLGFLVVVIYFTNT